MTKQEIFYGKAKTLSDKGESEKEVAKAIKKAKSNHSRLAQDWAEKVLKEDS